MMPDVAAIILAAGRGGRIGQPKIFLTLRDRCFWEWIALNLSRAGLEDTVIVIRPEHKKYFRGIRKPQPIVNPRPSRGMFSSLKIGYRKMPGHAGYLICPVDHPKVSAKTYRKLLAAFSKTPLSVIRPRYQRKPGHPIIIPGRLMRRLAKCRSDNRLDHLLKKYHFDFHDVTVSDENILRNINKIEDLRDADQPH